jgi:hypothetical protein
VSERLKRSAQVRAAQLGRKVLYLAYREHGASRWPPC